MKIQVPCASLFAALIFASKDATRVNFCGVCIDGADVIGTDGHRLLQITQRPAPLEKGQPMMVIPRADLEKLRKALKPKARREAICFVTERSDGPCVIFDLEAEGVTIRGTSQEVPQVFPDWRQVVPDAGFHVTYAERAPGQELGDERVSEPYQGWGCNADYLGSMGAVARCFDTHASPVVQLVAGQDELSPTRWRVFSPENMQIGDETKGQLVTIKAVTGVVMPCRT